MKKLLCLVASAFVLAACSEQPQSRGLIRNDKAPFAGTGKSLQDAGWKAGDKAGWEEHLKLRTRRGQDDFYGQKK